MKKLTILLCMLAISSLAYSTDVTGTIAVNTTWNLAGSPYVVTGNVTVDPGVTLTVDPNVIVKFNDGRSLFVYGTVNATNATFTSNNISPAPGIWNYLKFYSGSTSTFSGCNIEYGDYLDVDGGANVTINNLSSISNMYYYGIYNAGTLNLSNTTIDLAGYISYGYGIYVYGSSINNLNDVNIFNCQYGLYANSVNAQINFTDCNFSSNEWPVYFSYSADFTVSGSNDFTGNTRDAFYIYPGSLNKNWILRYVNVPYYFRTNFSITNTYTLTIESGNIIKFPYHTGMEIYGKLVANAGMGQNIFFTSERDDNWGGDTNNDGTTTAPAVSDWYGIRFFDAADNTSVMRRCNIRYAGYTSIGGISLYDAGPIIEYCELQQNYFGAYFQYASDPTFNYNTIGSSQKTPIAMSFEANPSFTDNVLSFMDNEYDAIGLLGGTLTANANVIKRDFTTVSNITYVMLAEIIVPSGFTLTIDPGIVIKSSSYTYRIRIQGRLVCDGTLADGITFTSVKDDNFGNPNDTNKDGTITTPSINDMGAIIFEDGHDETSILDYVLMKYAAVWNYKYSNGGTDHYLNSCAVATLGSLPSPAGPTISNCEFRELNYGISCYQVSNPVITNNSMVNIAQTPFAIAASANPTFSGNTYTNCGLNALGLLGNNVVSNGTIIKRDIAGYTNITYVLLEDITILNSTYLDIDPGVVIKMSNKRWYIDGSLAFNGTVSEHVTFTSFKDDNVGNPMDTNGDGNATSPAAGDWYNIEYRESSDDINSVINYTDFQYGGYSNQGMVRWTNAGANMNHTVIDRSSSFGLWINGNSDPTIDNVAIQNCSSDPIAMSLTSNPTFTNISLAANLSNGIFLIEGLGGYSLSTNATLNKRSLAGFSNIAYIADDLLINAGAVLTLEEGIIMKFRGSYFVGIYTHGGLNATGTLADKIIFTSIKDDSAGGDTNNDGSSSIPTNYDWTGLIYYEESIDVSNILEYCEVRYTGGGYGNAFGANTTWGAVRIKDAKVTVNETVFQQGYGNAFGIFGTADPLITNCDIYNFTQEPVYMAMFSNPTFSGNTVANVGKLAIGIQPETYSQTATFIQRDFAGFTNITYMFYGATVNSGTTITIPAGTVFKSDGRQDFSINGTLEMDGAPGNEVIFTDWRDDNYGNPADTEQNGTATSPVDLGGEIVFNDVSDDDSFINFSIMRYNQYPIRLYSASPTITNNLFYKSFYAISNSGVCTPVIDNNTFDDLSYAPLSISLVAYPASTSGNLITGTTYKMIRVNDETLTSDQVLPKRSFGGVTNIPYFFSSYTIGTGVTLTIDPGVVCKFWNGGSMSVNNGLLAQGTPVSGGYIVFTSTTDDFYGGDSNSDGTATAYDFYSWYGITINDVALDPLCLFDNCIFRWCEYGTGYGIKTISSSPTITNCSFNNCDYGVYAQAASNPTINFCDFYNIQNMGVYNVNQSFLIDAENNWWGSNTGPTHSGNPGGTGEPVSDGVDYDPYGTSGAINPLLGDVSLNSVVQAYDATLVLLYALDNGVTYPLTPTQQNVGDVTGNGIVSALDAAHILQFVVGFRSYFDASLLTPAPNFVSEVALDIANASVEPGEEFELPLSISNVSEVLSMQMTLVYDPAYLTALEIENLIPEMNIAQHIDEETGMISIAFAGVESLETDITIANLKFKAKEGIGLGFETPVEATFFMANETDLTWNAHSGTVYINGFATGLKDHNNLNNQIACYPNPFKDELTIEYTVQQDGNHIFIGVYNLFGQLVSEIANGQHAKAHYKIRWDGTSSDGSNLENGIYFLRFKAGDRSTTRKIQIVR
ncbi:MAG: right-handed parallel beta-helix repeat-containing protein [Bacteroidetes bacterium]|nr:right-handed parallel beta-helix repeat-containing protein [Bacteroidota bacterium]